MSFLSVGKRIVLREKLNNGSAHFVHSATHSWQTNTKKMRNSVIFDVSTKPT